MLQILLKSQKALLMQNICILENLKKSAIKILPIAISDKFRFSWIPISAEVCKNTKATEKILKIIVFTSLAAPGSEWIQNEEKFSFYSNLLNCQAHEKWKA